MKKDLTSESELAKKTKNIWLRAHLFTTVILPALTCALETWRFCKQKENAINVMEWAIEKVMLGVFRFMQVEEGIGSLLLRHRSNIREVAAYANESKIRWAGHVMRFNDNTTLDQCREQRPPTRCSDLFKVLQ
ncbi:hypothetical protein RB195_003985 [Necator americanus]|uniref:Uncharacterized protein n=1 Tax=Necator americanus TaxID=51031 RepID=A0ABR1DR53_NECAM